MAIDGYKFSKSSGGGTGAMDGKDGTSLHDLDLALVLDPDSDTAKIYLLNENSGKTADGEEIVEPATNAGPKRWEKKKFAQTNTVPVGAIVAWVGGYFANGDNGGFVNIIGNDAASINAAVNIDGWYVCDGTELNLPSSPIYNGSGRHLPNLTDSRFIMGAGSPGAAAGSNNQDHYHSIIIPGQETGATTLTVSQIPAHLHQLQDSRESTSTHVHTDENLPNFASPPAGNHPVHVNYSFSTGGGQSHTHTSFSHLANTDGASNLENRPKFLSCVFLQKVK